MTAYLLGDVPAQPVLLSPVRDGRTVDLEPFDAVAATLLTPTGAQWGATAQLVTDPDEGRVVSCLVPAHLDVAGLHWLRLELEAGDAHETFSIPVVVERLDGWHTLASARLEWEDAGELNDARLHTLLEVARVECLAYAPALEPAELPPANYRLAQLTHARNRNEAWRVDPVGGQDAGSFAIGAFPMDWVVKQMLRPQRGYKAVR